MEICTKTCKYLNSSKGLYSIFVHNIPYTFSTIQNILEFKNDKTGSNAMVKKRKLIHIHLFISQRSPCTCLPFREAKGEKLKEFPYPE